MTCPDCSRAMQRVMIDGRRVYACAACSVAWIPEDGTLVRLPADDATKPSSSAPSRGPINPLEEALEHVIEDLLDSS